MEQQWFRDGDGVPLALLIPRQFEPSGYNFLTPPEMPLQLGVNSYAAGRVVPAHKHKRWARTIEDTMEFVLVRKGKVRVTLFGEDDREAATIELSAGDMMLFVAGGHSWEFLEDAQVMEIKQGPYASVEQDKTLLASVSRSVR